MKTLVVVRHAKSSWKDSSLRDSERPLNKRGHRTAPAMGKRLRKREFKPDMIFSSRANRALTTACYIADEIGFDKDTIRLEEALYHRSTAEMLDFIRRLDNKYDKVMIFGHNPGFTDLINKLTNSSIYNVPTAGLALIKFPVDHWKDTDIGQGELSWYSYPKKVE